MMQKRDLLILSGVLALMTFFVLGRAGADVAIVGNKDLGVSKLSLAQVKAIWFGQRVTIGTTKPVAADLPAKDQLRLDFLSDVLGVTLKQFRMRRTRLAFTHQLAPPKVVSNQSDLKEWVAANPERVGYLRPEMVDSTVQVLLRVRN